MKNHRSNFSGINNILKASVCAGALMAMMGGVAYGQFGGSVSGQGSKATDGSGWGLSTDAMLPFATDGLSQMFYGLVGVGYQDSNPTFSLGAGYRVTPGYGEMMLGANIRGESWRSSGKNWFYGVVPGVEVVWGGVSVSANAYVPVGKTTRSVKGTDYSKPALVDRPTTPGFCDPTQTNRDCDLVIQNWGRDRERNNWGADIQLGYRLPFLESIDIEVAMGGYMFDRKGERNLTGLTGGVDFIVPLGENFTLNASGKMRRESSGGRGTDALFNLGFTYQWGGAGEATADYLKRKLLQAPRRLDHSYSQQVIEGGVIGRQGAISTDNPSNRVVSRVQFVNRDNRANAQNILVGIPQDGVVVFDGSRGEIEVANTLSVMKSNVLIMGGGAGMTLKGAVDGKTYQFTMDGTRPTIRQTVVTNYGFAITNRNDVVFRSLDVRGGINSFLFTTSNNAQLFDIASANTVGSGYVFSGSLGARLTNVKSTNAGPASAGLELNAGSHNAVVDGMQVDRAPGRGIFVNNSDNAQLKNITIIGGDAMAHITGNGIDLVNAKNILVQNANISFVKDHGINIINTSTGTQLEKVTIVDALQSGIRVRDSDAGMNGHFTNVRIDRTGRQGIDVTNSNDLKLADVGVSNTGKAMVAGTTDGISFNNSKTASLKEVSVDTTTTGGNGIVFFGSTGAVLDGITIKNTGATGLFFNFGSTNAKASNINIENAQGQGGGIQVTASDWVQLEKVVIDQSAMTAGAQGVEIFSSDNVSLNDLQLKGKTGVTAALIINTANNITIRNIRTSNWGVGYALTGVITNINAMSTGNTSTNDTQTCDGVVDIANTLAVQRTVGMMVTNESCN
ncbi:MAG: right-handed parallel beta-helix repeat-containing protein [Rhodospirillaceae bacterium]|nr:right-handed parallel beta-helix repeat-containing protein [Rhodospirillaceae bacterium]